MKPHPHMHGCPEQSCAAATPFARRVHAGRAVHVPMHGSVLVCARAVQVDGCNAMLAGLRPYFRARHICEEHHNAPCVQVRAPRARQQR